MDISFQPSKKLDPKTEFRRHLLLGHGGAGECFLDVDAKHLFDHVPAIGAEASDLLVFAAAVYGCDKAVQRCLHAEDKWTRRFNVEIPMIEPDKWTLARKEFEECVGFLTGDVWSFSFIQADRRPFVRRTNRIKKPKGMLHSAKAVSLLSGGLDSFAGAISYLEENPSKTLVIASHYDGTVAGPKSDQTNVIGVLQKYYPKRIQQLRVRVGLGVSNDFEGKFETSFRSRSLAFLAIANAVASTLKNKPNILIPENGAIALNFPLNSSRRGSCSTRTVHPHFLHLLQRALRIVGITNTVSNPFSMLTKGEVNDLVDTTPAFLAGYALTNSCAKSGHTFSWENRKASACGRCVPCLFRRASLHRVNLDNETFGNDVIRDYKGRQDLPDDLRSLIDLLNLNPSQRAVMRGLISNGSLPPLELPEHANVVLNMISEVREWIKDTAPRSLKNLASIK